MGRKRKAVEPEESPEEAQQANESMTGSSQAKEAGPSPAEAGPSSDTSLQVNPKRYRELKSGEIKKGPVIYWYTECKQHNCCARFQAYQLRDLAYTAIPTIFALACTKPALAFFISVQMGWLQDVKGSAREGQLGIALCMRGGRALRLRSCCCLQLGAQQHHHAGFIVTQSLYRLMHGLEFREDMLGFLAWGYV